MCARESRGHGAEYVGVSRVESLRRERIIPQVVVTGSAARHATPEFNTRSS